MLQLESRVSRTTPSATWLSLAVLLFSVSFGWLLPPSYGQENGPVEWLQVIVLGCAALVAISALWQTDLTSPRRKLLALSVVVWLLSVARELSWGRVLYMDRAGHMPQLKALWYGSYVYPSITLVVLGALGYFFTQGLHHELLAWFKQGTFPVADFVIMAVAMTAADIIEHHSFGLLGERTELFEELGELIGYSAALGMMIDVVFYNRDKLKILPRR